jgi:hypothetical protein
VATIQLKTSKSFAGAVMLSKLTPILLTSLALSYLLNLKGYGEKVSVPQEVKPYIQEAKNIYNTCGQTFYARSIDKIEVEFVDFIEKDVIADCAPFKNKIRINKNDWEMLETYSREELILHELAHCVMFLKHDKREDSIMTAKGMLGIYYVNHYNRLINEHFGCKNRSCCKMEWNWKKYE